MNMWAVSALPVHKVDHTAGLNLEAGKPRSIRASVCTSTPDPLPGPPPNNPGHDVPHEEKGNQGSQGKRVMVGEKHQSFQTTSSGSSSLLSLASAERPPWEHAEESLVMSRMSSGMSTSSSMPSRERPESVQIFGKTLFNRRGKLRRDSGANSSGNSLSLAEYPSDATLPSTLPSTAAPNRESAGMPDFLRRLRTPLDDPAQNKLRISLPYNFQHLAHAHAPRDDLSNARPSSRLASPHIRPPSGSLAPVAGSSSEAPPPREERGETSTNGVEPHVVHRRRTRPLSLAPGQSLKHSPPSYHGRLPPARPPRSPIEASILLPQVPPRLSSRASLRQEDSAPVPALVTERSQTSNGFHYPPSFPVGAAGHSPPLSRHEQVAEHNATPVSRHSRHVGPPDVENWPLPCPSHFPQEAWLPNVPEEDEMGVFMPRPARTSRVSMAASNNSPLRGSQSVPMLRHRTFRQEMDFRRRSSGASDTLGHDVFAARRVLQTMMLDDCGFEALKTDSWEEDIDYCYEHAVEADCDYAWERPSLDFGRSDEEESFDARSSESMSSDMLASGRFDVPALSPASALSSATAGHEAFTPTAPAPSHTPFIPCPGDVMTATTKSMLHLHSTAFDMMVGEFHLSPLLLIPGDCRQHSSSSMQHSSPAVPEDGCDAAGARHFAFHFQNGCDEPGPALHADQRSSTPMHPQQRSSASTTASSAGSHVFERHASTTSAGTDFTAPNRSTTSLDIEALIPKPAAFHDHENEVQSSPPSAHARVDSKMAAMHPLLEHEATPAAAFASRSSESNLALWASADAEMPGRAPARHRRNDSVPLQVRRQRTRTASLGRPPPPVGQYALYGSPVRPAPATRV